MSEPASLRGLGGAIGGVLAAVLIGACAAGGFLLYRLVNPATMYAAPGAMARSAATNPGVQPPEAGGRAQALTSAPSTPARTVTERLPELTLPGLNGTAHRLSDWKGHPLVINFWATWCEPCRREIPVLKGLRHERSADRLEVVGIAVDFRDSVQKYVQDLGIDYPVLVGEREGYAAVTAFGMEPVLPFTVFADGAGRVVAVKVGELKGDEARLILDRVVNLERGRLDLPAAREQIASGLRRLSADRSGRTDAAVH